MFFIVFLSKYTPMFLGATSFNQPLNNWNITNLVAIPFYNPDMNYMFKNASSFNQNISNWSPNIFRPIEFDTGSGFVGQTVIQPVWR